MIKSITLAASLMGDSSATIRVGGPFFNTSVVEFVQNGGSTTVSLANGVKFIVPAPLVLKVEKVEAPKVIPIKEVVAPKVYKKPPPSAPTKMATKKASKKK